MKVFARYELAADEFARESAQPSADRALEPALLLEGAWPQASTSRQLYALDESIDGRFVWIDHEASRLAEQIDLFGRLENGPCDHGEVARAGRTSVEEGSPLAPAAGKAPPLPSPAYVHALALRYYLVKLLRLIVFVREVAPQLVRPRCELFTIDGQDADYAELLAELGRSQGFDVVSHRQPAPRSVRQVSPGGWRQTWSARLRFRIGQLIHWMDQQTASSRGAHPRRVVLCGNPRVLDPLCEELLRQRSQVGWLHDRFALRCWRRWRPLGVRQLICASDRALDDDQVEKSSPLPRVEKLCALGVRIDGIIERWLRERAAAAHLEETRFYRRACAHLRRFAPQAMILDEDATPRARLAIAAARCLSIPCWVVQHGVPGVRFGFTPLVADWFCAADEPSRQQLVDWGAPRDRVVVTGSPALDAMQQRFQALVNGGRLARCRANNSPTFLLLATTPPRDDRPDAVELHLTTGSYAKLLAAVSSVLAQFSGARLLVKAHPRDPAPRKLFRLLDRSANLAIESAANVNLERLLPQVDVVLSCGSTGGIEAAALGWPVVQLLPAGSGELLSAAGWNLVGTARTADELLALLPIALERAHRQRPRSTRKRAAINPAAARIVELLLQRQIRDRRDEIGQDIAAKTMPQMAG